MRSWQRRCGKGNEYTRSGPLQQAQGPVFIVRSVSLSNWPLFVALRPDLRVTKVWPFGKLRDRFSLYGHWVCRTGRYSLLCDQIWEWQKCGPSANSGACFHCTVSELVELAVIILLGTRFESDKSVALRQTQGPGFIVRSVSLSNWPLLFAEGPVKSCQSGALRSGKKIMVPPITVILCESRESRNTSSKEKTDPSSAVLTLTHISLRAGCFSDGWTHSFIRN